MAIEKKEVQVAKEADDVLVLFVELAKDLKAKKDLGAVAAENLPLLMAAISGMDQLGAEMAANKSVVLQTIGARMGELAGALLG